MHSTAESKSKLLLEWLAYWAAALLLQFVRQDWTGWSGNEDEPAHFLTGVMLHDFIAGNLFQNPLAFARNYYDHYPKIAIGHWPPVFYVLQGVWYLVASPGYVQGLMLMAAVSAGVALLISLETARFDRRLGWLMGGLWLALPSVRGAGGRVMAELVVTLFAFAAVCVYARYLEQPGTLRAAGFGVLASLAILTKATGAVLAATPVAAILLGRWRLLKRLPFWLPLPIVVFFCLPWYLLAPGARHDRALPMGGPRLVGQRGWNLLSGEALLPWALWLAAFAALLYAVWRMKSFPFAAAGAAFLVANLVGVSTLAVWELRHAVMIVPVMLVFCAYAIHALGRLRLGSAAVILAAVYCLTLDRPPSRANLRFAEAALAAKGVSPVMVAGHADFEGAFICEYALLERRPAGVVMRGSKALVSLSWFGRLIEERFHSPDEVAQFLAFEDVKMIVLDLKTDTNRADARLLAEVIRQSPGKWERVALTNSRIGMWRRVTR